MMRWMALLFLPVLMVCLPAEGTGAQPVDGDVVREGVQERNAAEWGVGRLVSVTAVKDLDGQSHEIGGSPTVFSVIDFTCPISGKNAPKYRKLHQEFAKQGVQFFLIGWNEKDDAARKAMTEFGLTMPYLPDRDHTLARLFDARTTTEIFILDAARTLVYRGAIDDQFGIGVALPEPKRHLLREALDSVLTGKQVATEATNAPGCALGLEQEGEVDAATANADSQSDPEAGVTWHNSISRILQRNCQTCHRQGEAGPFELVTYEDVTRRKAMIARVVDRGLMPPWFADPQHTPTGGWSNDRRIPNEDKEELINWLDSDMPLGDPADAPLAIEWPSGWQIGEPDMVIRPNRVYRIPETGVMDYKRVMVRVELDEDKWVSAMEVRPMAPQVVHHVLVFAHWPRGHERSKDQPRDNDGLTGYFAGMVPGQGHVIYPPGFAKFLPRGTMLQFQIHYTPNGKATVDTPQLGLIFADEPPEYEVKTYALFNNRFRIPPGEDNHAVQAQLPILKKGRLLAFMPHMHVRGKAFKYEMIDPAGNAQVLLNVPHYDFNWQLRYDAREPIDVPRGSILKATAWFDNSENNPANPDPKATVRFGDQTWDEMMIGYFDYYYP